MPTRPLRLCAQPGCSTLVERGRCCAHARRAQLDERRGSARQRGYDAIWEATRAALLESRRALALAEAEAAGPVRLAQVAALGRRRRDGSWQELPPCAHCESRSVLTPGHVVDHILPHRVDLTVPGSGDKVLLRSMDNLQPLCDPCHGAKGLRESGRLACAHELAATVLGRSVCALCGRQYEERLSA